jgi:hypothetical protein
MTATLILTAALALGVQQQQQQQQQTPPPAAPVPAAAAQKADAPAAVMFTGCVIAAPDREDSFQLVPAEPDPARPVGTSGAPSPAWTVPAFLLLGGNVTAEHLSKTVEITGTIDPAPAPAADPKKTGDTTQRTGQAAAPVAQLQVQSVKIVAATCTPKKAGANAR